MYLSWDVLQDHGWLDLRDRLHPYFNVHVAEDGDNPLLDPLFIIFILSSNVVVFGISTWAGCRLAGPGWRVVLAVLLMTAVGVGALRHRHFEVIPKSGTAAASLVELVLSVLSVASGGLLAARYARRGGGLTTGLS
jgi:hypothetical protein